MVEFDQLFFRPGLRVTGLRESHKVLRVQATLALQKWDNFEVPSVAVFAGPVIPPVGEHPGVFPVRPMLLAGHSFGNGFWAGHISGNVFVARPVVYHPHEDPGDPDEPEDNRAHNVGEAQHRGHQHRDDQDKKLEHGRQKIPEVPRVLSLFAARVVVVLGIKVVVVLIVVFFLLSRKHTAREIEIEGTYFHIN